MSIVRGAGAALGGGKRSASIDPPKEGEEKPAYWMGRL